MLEDLFYVEKFEYIMPDQSIIVDPSRGGLFNFNSSRELSLITSCNSYTLSYGGPFRIVNDRIFTDIMVSNRESFFGTTIDRQIISYDGDRLILNKAYPERIISLTWRKLNESLLPTESQPWVGTFKQVGSKMTDKTGIQCNENVTYGMLTLTREGTISSVHGGDTRFFAYLGKYRTVGNERIIKVSICTNSTVEGTELRRKVTMTGKNLMHLAQRGVDGNDYESTWIRI